MHSLSILVRLRTINVLCNVMYRPTACIFSLQATATKKKDTAAKWVRSRSIFTQSVAVAQSTNENWTIHTSVLLSFVDLTVNGNGVYNATYYAAYVLLLRTVDVWKMRQTESSPLSNLVTLLQFQFQPRFRFKNQIVSLKSSAYV